MIAPSAPRFAACATAAVVVMLVLAASAGAVNTEIHSCNQQSFVVGRATLTRDLDCSGSNDYSVLIDRGSLDLNGHTLVTGTNYGIYCDENCKVVGPGTITGAGSGIFSVKSLRVVNVDIVLTGGIGAASDGKLALEGVTISGAAVGAVGRVGAKIIDSTITAYGTGVLAGSGFATGGSCEKGSLLLRRSSVTGADPALCVGADPPQNCVDLFSCKPPKLSQSMCGTSCQGGTGAPCATWGVCSAD